MIGTSNRSPGFKSAPSNTSGSGAATSGSSAIGAACTSFNRLNACDRRRADTGRRFRHGPRNAASAANAAPGSSDRATAATSTDPGSR